MSRRKMPGAALCCGPGSAAFSLVASGGLALVIVMSGLFNEAGLQSYSGVLGFTAFCYWPGGPAVPGVRFGFNLPLPQRLTARLV